MNNNRNLAFWLGIGISIFFMMLLFRKINFSHLVDALRLMDYRYVLAAVAGTFFSYFLRAVRWRYLLLCEKTIPLASLYPATIIGYMANNLLPARLGEFIRAYVLAQREGLATPAVLASLVIDRLFDGGTVLLMLLITLWTLQLPPAMQEVGLALKAGGALMATFYCAVLLFLYLLKRYTVRMLAGIAVLARPFPRRLQERLIPLIGSFIGGIRMSSRGHHTAMIVCSSLLIWTFAVIPVDLTLRAFGVHLPISASLFILVLLVFAVMVPASPGYIGTYHYACFKGLSVFGIPEATAVSIALIIHGTSFFPVILAGFYHLWSTKMSLTDLQKRANEKP